MNRKPKAKAPIDCSFDELCRIRRDNLDVGEFWILCDSYVVTIAQQNSGESARQQIIIPVPVFRKMVSWITKPQVMGAAGGGT